MKYKICLILLCWFLPSANAQHSTPTGKMRPEHSLGIVIGHAHIFEGRDELGNKKRIVAPLWGIDYNLRLSHKWTVGLHTDIIVESFEVEKHLSSGNTAEVIERSYPIAPAIMGIYSMNHHWNLGIGAGAEFAKGGNYFLNRAALEYTAHIGKRWELTGALQYDFRWNAYDTWSIGLGVQRVISKK